MALKRDVSFEVHFGWGLAIALGFCLFGWPPVVAWAVALVAGVAVEVIQWAWPATGAAQPEDAIYTGLGGLAGAILGVLA
jgi:hypothetical protein